MIIKKYIANSFEEAEGHMRSELGPKGVMLASRYVPQKGWRSFFSANKVEVTAAIEEDDLEFYNKENLTQTKKKVKNSETRELGDRSLNETLEGLKKSVNRQVPVKEEVVKGDTETYGDPRYRSRAREGKASVYQKAGNSSYGQEDHFEVSSDYSSLRSKSENKMVAEGSESSHTALQVREDQTDMEKAKRKLAALRSIGTKKNKPVETDSLNQLGKGLVDRFGTDLEKGKPPIRKEKKTSSKEEVTLESLRKIIREEMEERGVKSSNAAEKKKESGCLKFLVSKGIDQLIAEDITYSIEKDFEGVVLSTPNPRRTEMLNRMKRELAKKVPTTGPIFLKRGASTVVALVGPTGVGKTSTLVKIANQYVKGLHKKVAVVSIDYKKVGAREQIQALTGQLNIPLEIASDREGLIHSLEKLVTYDLVFIDTSGCNHYDSEQVEELSKLFKWLDNVKVLLTISATTKDLDAYGIVKKFSKLNIDSLVFTKMDETIADGLIINVCMKTGKPVRYLTKGQRVNEDLTIAESNEVAKGILVQNNGKEFDEIRELIKRDRD